MTPRPPIWMSTRITASPKPDQNTGVSVTISPVTHTADVAVNRACMRPRRPESRRTDVHDWLEQGVYHRDISMNRHQQ